MLASDVSALGGAGGRLDTLHAHALAGLEVTDLQLKSRWTHVRQRNCDRKKVKSMANIFMHPGKTAGRAVRATTKRTKCSCWATTTAAME